MKNRYLLIIAIGPLWSKGLPSSQATGSVPLPSITELPASNKVLYFHETITNTSWDLNTASATSQISTLLPSR